MLLEREHSITKTECQMPKKELSERKEKIVSESGNSAGYFAGSTGSIKITGKEEKDIGGQYYF